MTAKNETGQVYKTWLVGERIPLTSGWAGVRWNVTCLLCGATRWLFGFTLRQGKAPRCACQRPDKSEKALDEAVKHG